jgi:hypothetical protein
LLAFTLECHYLAMAAIFTDADLSAVKTALITAATSGIASVTLSGQMVTSYTLTQLQELLKMIQADLATATDRTQGGMRFLKTVPPGAG